MKKLGCFLDVNISLPSVVYSIFCTVYKYKTKQYSLGRLIFFYSIPNFFNLNLNIRIKNNYFAINFSGIIAELLCRIFIKDAEIDIKHTNLNPESNTNIPAEIDIKHTNLNLGAEPYIPKRQRDNVSNKDNTNQNQRHLKKKRKECDNNFNYYQNNYENQDYYQGRGNNNFKYNQYNSKYNKRGKGNYNQNYYK